MANQYDNDEDFDDLDEGQHDSNGPANLRKALKKAESEKKAMAEELAQIRNDLRSRAVKDTLATKGVSDKVAKFIPADVATPEQIDQWLADNADVFGFVPTERQSEKTAEQVENQRAYERISASTQNASTPNRDADLASKIAGAKSLDELNAITGNPTSRFRG
jgi:hypothetical protein